MRSLHLALDLGLADDHRLQAGGHPEEVARGLAVARRVDRLGELGRADRGAAGQQSQHLGLGAHGVPHHQVDLGAVARRDHDRLAHLGGRRRLLHELVRLGLGERQTLAQRHRRRLVRDAQRQQLAHARVDSWSSERRAPRDRRRSPAPPPASSPSRRSMRLRRTRHDRHVDQHERERHHVGARHVLARLVQRKGRQLAEREGGHQPLGLPPRARSSGWWGAVLVRRLRVRRPARPSPAQPPGPLPERRSTRRRSARSWARVCLAVSSSLHRVA